jgi:hypothetical protein
MTYLDNDLALLAALGDEVPLPRMESLTASRARLAAAITAGAEASASPPVAMPPVTVPPADVPPGAGQAGHPTGSARRRAAARWAGRRSLLAAAAVAAAAVVAVTVLSTGSGSPTPGGPATARLTAVQVLDSAAAAALREPAVLPRPGQFYYTEVVTGGAGMTRTWRSVDGSRDGVELDISPQQAVRYRNVIRGCRGGKPAVRLPGDGGNKLEPCRTQPAYLPGMPGTSNGMDDFLARVMSGFYGSHVSARDLRQPVIRLKDVSHVLETNYLLPAQRAALYNYLATTPGLKVVSDVPDATGRRGVAVTWPGQSYSGYLIFDPKTYAYLGMREVLTAGASGNDTTLVSAAIVDQVGQRPAVSQPGI